MYYLVFASIIRADRDICFKALASPHSSVVCWVPAVAPLKSAKGHLVFMLVLAHHSK